MSIRTIIRTVEYNTGLHPRRLGRAIKGIRPYLANQREFDRQSALSAGEFPLQRRFPCLIDRYDKGGVASGVYFHQDLYVAQAIHRSGVKRHVDVGSRVDGFVAHVAAFCHVEVHDIRPMDTTATNISFVQRDIMDPAPAYDRSTNSLSCLHALEHFGLGRYGDKVDYYGFQRGWDGLSAMLRPGGVLFFSVPIGRQQRVEFDGQRVFSLPFLRDQLIRDRYILRDFAFVDDRGDLHRAANVEGTVADRTYDLVAGCGIFELELKAG